MLDKLYDLFGLHTVDSIVAPLDKMVVRLRAHGDKMYGQAVDSRAQAAILKLRADDSERVGDRAHATADKVAALLA